MGPRFDGHDHGGGPGWDRHGPGWPGDPGGYGGPHGHGGSTWGGGPPWAEWWLLLPGLLVAMIVLAGLLYLGREALLSPLTARIAPDPWRTRWDGAARRHGATARAYAAFECDVREVLRLPALADVTQPATARFVDAFAEAGALLTDTFPGREYAGRFAAAVERAERAWTAAVDAAERARDARFAPGERKLVGQVSALLDVALSSPYEAERRTAYQRAVHRLAELERRTGWRLPRPAALELEHRARGVLVASAG